MDIKVNNTSVKNGVMTISLLQNGFSSELRGKVQSEKNESGIQKSFTLDLGAKAKVCECKPEVAKLVNIWLKNNLRTKKIKMKTHYFIDVVIPQGQAASLKKPIKLV